MGRPKKEVNKDKQFYIRCTPEQYSDIKNKSEGAGVTMGEFALAKIFDLKIVPVGEKREITYYKKNKAGEDRPYKLNYSVKRKAAVVPNE